MANFDSPPSWLTTLRYLGHILLPGYIKAKGFPPLSVREQEALRYARLAVQIMAGFLVAFMVLLTGMVMTVSFFGALIIPFVFLVVGPLAAVTVLWLGLKIIVEDPKE